MTIKVFVSYSHRDASYLADDSLLGFIKGLEQEGVEFWWDHSLVAGDYWDDEIKSRIRDSHIALVLISQWFLDSAYCVKTEVSGFIEKCRESGLIIFPIILSPCEWERHDWLRTRQFLPSGSETIEEHYVDAGRRKKLFLQIRQQLRKQIDRVRGQTIGDSADRSIDSAVGLTTTSPTTLDPDKSLRPPFDADQSVEFFTHADQRSNPPSDGKLNPPTEPRSRHRMSWIFGSLLVIFFLYVYLFSPDTLPEYKQRMLAFACGLIAGLFVYSLTGDIALEIKSARSRTGTNSIKATGGFAAFVLMLLWWFSPLAPVKATDPPLRPEPAQIAIYRLRVTVLNPQQGPVSDADVYSSASGERKRVDGGWEIDIPAASKPADGKITVYASKPAASLYGQQDLVLDRDANPSIKIQLRVGEPPSAEGAPPPNPVNNGGSSPPKPTSPSIAIYRVRVTVLDTERTVVEEAEIHSMPSGVVKRVSGGWEIEIPAANKPADGTVKIYASKPSAFLKADKSLRLDKDPNPTVEIQLRKDASAPVSGWVKDSSGQGIAGALVYACEHRGEAVRTGPDGKFDLTAHKAKGQSVKMCAEKEGYITRTQYHPAGTIPMTIILPRGQQ